MKRLSNARRQRLDNALTYGIVAIGYGILQLLRSGGVLSSALQGMLVPICAYAVMAVSLNLVVGISGELSLGHAGFMSVGAFTGIITAACLQNTVGSAGLRLLIAMVVGAVFAGLVGVLVGVPVLRLRGDYLAIVTLAFGEIIKNIINCLYVGIDASGLHISLKNEAALGLAEGGRTLIKGPMGATGITKLSGFTAADLAAVSDVSHCAEPHPQPLRPCHYGPAGQPHRGRECRLERDQVQAHGLRHLGGAGRRGGRPVCAELQLCRSKKV